MWNGNGISSRDGKLSRLGKIISFGFYASNSVFKLFNYVNNQLSYSSQLKLVGAVWKWEEP